MFKRKMYKTEYDTKTVLRGSFLFWKRNAVAREPLSTNRASANTCDLNWQVFSGKIMFVSVFSIWKRCIDPVKRLLIPKKKMK